MELWSLQQRQDVIKLFAVNKAGANRGGPRDQNAIAVEVTVKYAINAVEEHE
jgi:hypothetical protein